MKRTEKEQLVSELRDKLQGATSLYYTDFTGLNVKRMTELRRRLKRAGVDYVVIKNTLALRAVNESGLVGEKLKGPTGLVLGADPVAAAKVLTDFAKEFEQKPAVKGGLLEGKAVDAAQVKQLFAIAEAYPDLKAGGSFLQLQKSLVEIEDHLQNARRYYNAVVRDLNTRIAQFPAVLVAAPLGFKAEEFFGLENAAEAAVPQVKV